MEKGEGAEVYLDGKKVGITPLSITVPRRKDQSTILVQKEGYKDRQVVLDTTVEPVFFVNILSGGVFGSTTDFASESMFKYAPSTINVDLVKKSFALQGHLSNFHSLHLYREQVVLFGNQDVPA